jgi:uncharacterized RmlC-like cupin family protein
MVPAELSKYFSEIDFNEYPKIKFPQTFVDERGKICNLADGAIGDVALISSEKNSIRANHFHHSDWHITYLVQGNMTYSWSDTETSPIQSVRVNAGEGIYTPPKVPHRMLFTNQSLMIAISRNSRTQDNYEKDTERVLLNYVE